MSRSRKDVDTLSIADAQREAAMLDRLPKHLAGLVKRSSPRPLSVSGSCASRTRPLGNECKRCSRLSV